MTMTKKLTYIPNLPPNILFLLYRTRLTQSGSTWRLGDNGFDSQQNTASQLETLKVVPTAAKKEARH